LRNGKADDAEILKTGRKTLVCGNFCINAAGSKLKFVELLSENLREAEVELNYLSKKKRETFACFSLSNIY
jgi:hypothetical protein